MPVGIVQATVSGTKPRLFASIDAVNKSDNAGSLRGRLFGVLFFFTHYDHGANLYGFMTYLEVATETKGFATGRENWAGFYAGLL
ncbi:MAG: hypothetical protein PHC51_02465 [bacterium]|nr:hypothetical protein [bacterium]MDD2941808.1 hypothetical protein [bacterium]